MRDSLENSTFLRQPQHRNRLISSKYSLDVHGVANFCFCYICHNYQTGRKLKKPSETMLGEWTQGMPGGGDSSKSTVTWFKKCCIFNALNGTEDGKMMKMKMIRVTVKKIMVRREVRMRTLSNSLNFQRMLYIVCKWLLNIEFLYCNHASWFLQEDLPISQSKISQFTFLYVLEQQQYCHYYLLIHEKNWPKTSKTSH
jgi:hypothetical protein